MRNVIAYEAVTYARTPDSDTAGVLLRDISHKKTLLTPRQIDKPLVLYGAGNLGKMAKEYLDRIGAPLEFVIDKNPDASKNDPCWSDVTIIAPNQTDQIDKRNFLLAVSICTSPFSELHAVLSDQGWSDVVPFYDITEAYRQKHPLGNGWFADKLCNNDIGRIDSVLSGWADDISRAHHLQFIAWRTLREDWFFKDALVTMHDRYFIPQILSALHEREIFLDVGAHHGEVCVKFARTVDYRFQTILAIEPDTDNLVRLREQISDLSVMNKIQVLECAVGELSGTRLFYNGLGYASQFCNFAKEIIPVRTIDELNLNPTFMKIHIEGTELEALKGSLRTIAVNRPIIATTSYHNHLGIWQLPDWLMSNLSDYTFLLRLHSWSGTGAVVYAIPNERYVPV